MIHKLSGKPRTLLVRIRRLEPQRIKADVYADDNGAMSPNSPIKITEGKSNAATLGELELANEELIVSWVDQSSQQKGGQS